MPEPPEPCEVHRLLDCKTCALSEVDGPQYVWISEGSGAAYHKKKNCRLLRRGQKFVVKRGGTPAPVIAVPIKTAKMRDKGPCQACFPWKK